MTLEINPEFEQALNLMHDSNQHLFITGRAGTGKSTLLKHFVQNTQKKVVVLAPTGIAAIQVRGQTIHSFCGFPPHPVNLDHIRKRKKDTLYKELDTIIIDEISMVRADLLDGIDHFMRINGKNRSQPFGGCQMIFIGDLYQLPPVLSSDIEKQLFQFRYPTPYFFSAQVLNHAQLNKIELTKIYRQEDRYFIDLLECIRTKEIEPELIKQINEQCYKPNFKPQTDEHYITLTSTNYLAQQINNHQLSLINKPQFSFQGELSGEFVRQKNTLPNDEVLHLKEGSQVMFVRNDQWYRWVNGTIGTVQMIDQNSIHVSIKGNKTEAVYKIDKATWEIVRYTYNEAAQKIETEVLGTFNQYPIKLAWALTIHKSQGNTFDKVIIDFGNGAFAPGQAYVAFSRCRTLQGIVLKRPFRFNDVIIDQRIKNMALR